MSKKVKFGFKEVESNEKQHLVQQVFSSVAHKYDLMNDVMSFGIHRLWKNKLIEQLDPNKRLLDMASGTGDIAKRYYQKNQDYGKESMITLCDINFDMLSMGRNKLIDENIFQGLDFICCNAENLPFDDLSFDYYTIAFGIRNVTNIEQALKEASRVLKPGGKFVCMEFARVSNEKLAAFYDCYSMNVIPTMGDILVGDKASYQYLVESIRSFPVQNEFIKMMSNAGMQLCKFENLTFGVVALYTGYKI